MPTQDFWEQRYAEEEYAYGVKPNAFLVTQIDRLAAGAKVLVIGDGEGRNGVWLAEQGFDVHTVDYSAEGLKKAQRLAAERGTTLHTQQADLTTWDWPVDEYDAVVTIYVHFPSDIRPALHQRMLQCLKPGGLLIEEAFHKRQLNFNSGGPPSEDMLYTQEILRDDAAGAEILLLEETDTTLDEGRYHSGDAAVLRLVARRPR